MLLQELVNRDEVPPQIFGGHLAFHVSDPQLNVIHSMKKLLVLPGLL